MHRATPIVERLATEGRPKRADGLAHPRAPLAHGYVEHGELFVNIATSNDEVDPALAQVVDREEQWYPEHDQEQQPDERDRRDRDRELVEARPPHEAHRGHHADDRDADEEVGRARRQRVPAHSVAEVVRHEERRERDHDHVVEEDRPAGEEAELVIERAPAEVKRELDSWGDLGAAGALMKRLKEQLDPQGVMAPGRMAG